MMSVMAMDASSGNESYVWSVQAAETIGGTYRTIATMARAAADGPGTFVIPLGRDDARILGLPNSVFLRIVATLAGTSPSVDYAAWITQASRGSTTTLG